MADSTTSAEATPAAATPAASTPAAATPAAATSATPRATGNRSTTPVSAEFARYIAADWAERPDATPSARTQASFAASRRDRISALHVGARLIVPAGAAKTRSNDTDYAYRAHSAFAYLTGWGSDTVAGSVLVLEPTATGHEATLYFRETAGRDTDEFYANSEIGEFWTGARPTLAHVAADLGLSTAPLDSLASALEKAVASTVSIDVDPRWSSGAETGTSLLQQLSEMRLVKDEFELAELRIAVDATKLGFDDVIADLGEIAAHPRGERLVEGTFNRRARLEGNTVGYDTIAASGPHACILHWTRNDGPVMPGDLILIDAGVELDSYYTADITRTLPVNGRFSAVQRRVYEAVLDAADAAFAIVRPGIRFREIHAEAMKVIAARTAEWGLLPVSAEESLKPELQYHRRYMVHGTSHHLGLDVHDCAQARREMYLDGVLEAGMVFTIEPGLYFQPDDLSVPAEYRGIGVRIEDNILVTETGAENLSIGIPRTAGDVEAWLARGRA